MQKRQHESRKYRKSTEEPKFFSELVDKLHLQELEDRFLILQNNSIGIYIN